MLTIEPPTQKNFTVLPKQQNEIVNKENLSANTNIENLFAAHALRTKQENKEDENNYFKQKLFDYSKLVFSRESTYRGFVDLFAEDTPALAAEAFRGKAAFLEALFKHSMTTSMIFFSPYITKFIAYLKSFEIFNSKEENSADYKYLMLFSREDLDNQETFDKARSRIISEEVQDQLNMAQFYGFDSKKAKHTLEEAKRIQTFMSAYKPSDGLREKTLRLKDEVIKVQTWIEGAFWSAVPFIDRLFRKYVLGVNRFVGSMKYLSDEDANKLGNKENFTAKQIFGTIACMFSSPIIINVLMSMIKNPAMLAKSAFVRMLKGQLDTNHGFYPKLGLFIIQGDAAYLMSKVLNSQDVFEMVENLIKFVVTGSSLFFGDRVTNGSLARNVDDTFTRKHKLEPGVFYYREPGTNGGLFSEIKHAFPEAAKYQHVLDKTKHDPKLEREATKLYQKTFYKGFALHAIGTFLLKLFVNWTTRTRVAKALKLSKEAA